MQQLPSSVLRLWRGLSLVAGLGVLAGGLIVAVWLDRADVSVGWFWLAPLIGGLVVTAIGFAVAGLRYRTWSFGLDEKSIEARWGVVTHRRAVVARNRVQTITTDDGPIDRLLGLTTLTVHTAGARSPNLLIPHLDLETVAWIRDELADGDL